MSKLEELIQELCPNGVEYRKLEEIGIFFSGLSGKNKNDFIKGNARFITYLNVFNNIAVKLNSNDFVIIKENEHQNKLQLGDIIFTSSSENIEECGMSSVVTENIKENTYLNSFCIGFRLNSNILLPNFSKYLFRSLSIRKQIIKTANGVTRFNISKTKMAKISIPLPPLEVQKEIVRILDTFTELTTELTLRKKQYEYYREKLFTFDKNVEWVTLGEIGTFIRGNGLQKKDFVTTGYPCIHYGQIYKYFNTSVNNNLTYINKELYNKLKKASFGDLIIAITSENIEDVCKSIVWLGNTDIAIGGHSTIYKHSQQPKFIAYYFQTNFFQVQKKSIVTGTKVIEVSPSKLSKIKIPLPSLEEQECIVKILDKFDALCNDLSIGLPAEIEKRQKQYKYYREKLLTFKEKQ